LWKHWSPSLTLDSAEWEATAASFRNPDWVDVTIDSYRHRWGLSDGDPSLAADDAMFAACPIVSVPTIVLHGDEDGATLPGMSENKEHLFSGGYERRVLAGVGHFVPREDPGSVTDAVMALLGR
jgi:pimeloyl-ACP methyl ester carboxylesterase